MGYVQPRRRFAAGPPEVPCSRELGYRVCLRRRPLSTPWSVGWHSGKAGPMNRGPAWVLWVATQVKGHPVNDREISSPLRRRAYQRVQETAKHSLVMVGWRWKDMNEQSRRVLYPDTYPCQGVPLQMQVRLLTDQHAARRSSRRRQAVGGDKNLTRTTGRCR